MTVYSIRGYVLKYVYILSGIKWELLKFAAGDDGTLLKKILRKTGEEGKLEDQRRTNWK